MSKRKKLYNLRHGIFVETEHVCVLLEHLIFSEENTLDKDILAEIALEKIHI